jgi:tellurite resistance protein
MQIDELVLRAIAAIRSRVLSHEHSLTSIVDLATLVAVADGVIDEHEEAALAAWLSRLLHQELGTEGVQSLVRSSLAVTRGVGAETVIRAIAHDLRTCGVAEEGLLLALAVGYVSDGLSAVERAVADQLARALAIPAERVDALARSIEAAMASVPRA